MVRVDFLGPIEKQSMDLEVGSLQELKQHLSQDPAIKQWLQNSSIAVNDAIVDSIDTKLQSGDTVAILPPVCGG